MCCPSFMLRIGDIHITSGYKDRIIDELRRVVTDADEESVVFLGDYVYHFSYDRKALLAFVDLLMELQREGRVVYVLAGNHDWLQGHFVYQEAQRVVESLGGDQIYFITEPMWKEIDGQWVLFLPWNPSLRDNRVNSDSSVKGVNSAYVNMTKSSHKWEQLSGHVNLILGEMLAKRPTEEDVILAHHYYVANTQFPGQKWRFGYKSVALDPVWCDRDDMLMISGHIHKPFVRKNYLCLGSVWATHPQEYNQTKVVLRYYDGVGRLMPMEVNYYASIVAEEWKIVTSLMIDDVQEKARKEAQSLMTGGKWTIETEDLVSVPMEQVSLQLQVDQRSYQSMDERVEESLQQTVCDIQLQTKRKSYEDLVSDLIISYEELQESYVQWKTILETYVTNKYPEEKEEYVQLLQESSIL